MTFLITAFAWMQGLFKIRMTKSSIPEFWDERKDEFKGVNGDIPCDQEVSQLRFFSSSAICLESKHDP
jgi:hypothetical protein